MKLANISVRQPVFVTMLMSAILVIGIVSYTRIAVELFPDISLPIVAVTTVYQGAGPEEVETQVTKPVEEALSSLNGVESIRSTSSEGISVVIVEFKLEQDPRQAATDVRDKVASVRNELPRDVFDPVIDKFDPSASPIISFGVVGRNRAMPLDRIRSIVEDEIKPLVERLDGVASVEIIGGLEREIHVNVDYNSLRARNLSILQIVQALRAENLNLPAGRLAEGQHEMLLRTQGEFRSVQEISDIIVASPGGVPIYLKEVASVEDGFKEQRSISRLNGTPCVVFSVRKASGSNTVTVAQAVQKQIERFKQSRPDIDIRLSADESEFIREAKNDVMLSLLLGALFASTVVFVSFGDFRNTLITVAGLPICIIGAFAVMYYLGYSMNVITLLALSLSVGLLIDDAIVVRENIFRRMEEFGEDSMTAAREGTSEVGLAVTATTLTIVAVFVPVAFATGIAGKFFREFGLTVAAAVMISLLEAFTFAPVLSAYYFKKVERGRETAFGRMIASLARMYDRINEVYRPALVWSLNHRKSVLAVATFLFIGSLALVSLVGFGGSPRGERTEFNVLLEYPSGFNLGKSDAMTREFEGIMSSQKEVQDVFAVVGTTDGAVDQAFLHIRLQPGWKSKEFQDRIRPVLERVPGVKLTFQETSSFSGAAASALLQLPIQINVRGTDIAALTAVSDEIKRRISTVSGLVDVSSNLRSPRPEIQVHANRERASQLGVSTSQLATVVRACVGGDVATKFRQGEKEIDVRVRLEEADRRSLGQVTSLVVPTIRNTFVTLGQIAELRVVSGPTQISRQNRSRQIVVGGNISRDRALGDVMNDVGASLAGMTVPEGISLSYGGQAEQTSESFKSLGLSLLLAIIFVYMVLASQFGSFLQPFTIMLALPLAVIGAFVALLVVKRPFDTMAFIGLIMLMGLVTKNSILLIDYVNQDRRRGMKRSDAIVSAGMKRLRPILMTTLAMILGMIPVAMTFGTSTGFRVSMAVTIIGGLVSSTLLTLVVVPVVYTILDDVAARVMQRGDAPVIRPAGESSDIKPTIPSVIELAEEISAEAKVEPPVRPRRPGGRRPRKTE